MNAYFIHHPRNFTNEYSVYAIDREDAVTMKDFPRVFPGARQITRKEAIDRGYSRPREARSAGEQWYGGFESDRGGETIDEKIADCVSATRREVARRVSAIE